MNNQPKPYNQMSIQDLVFLENHGTLQTSKAATRELTKRRKKIFGV